MSEFQLKPARNQAPLLCDPYDSWITPDGDAKAGFYRQADGIVIRFYSEADFAINLTALTVTCWPALDVDEALPANLFTNAITPMLSNYQGGLNLHGSAVAGEAGALAFLGQSRSGKTTLAGAFASEGFGFLTEDVVDLQSEEGGYLVQPKRAELRLFADSAAHLFSTDMQAPDDEAKRAVGLPASVKTAANAATLHAIFLLGDGSAQATTIQPIDAHQALTQLLQHSFILDVEDKALLKAHFAALADLADAVPCYALDYPREFAELPRVIEAVKAQIERRLQCK